MIVTERLTPDVFRLPIEKIRAGYKSDIYFARTKLILERDGRRDGVTMQIFQKHADAVIVGTDQTLAILHVGAGRYRDRARSLQLFERYLAAERRLYTAWLALPTLDSSAYEPIAREVYEISRELASLWEPAWRELTVRSLFDGEIAAPYEPVMHIEGEYAAFAHLETLYLGALAEGTRVATNTRDVVAAANGKPVIMFGARHQTHEAQAGSGYAAYIGGAIGVSTDEQGEWWGSKGLGTVPHALIAVYGGDTTVATLKFDEYINRSSDAVGHLTAKGTPEGHVNVNPTGNPGMASGGMGDVLGGIIAALLARGAGPFDAACAGVYLHGFAGDMLRDEMGDTGLAANDLAEKLPLAIQRLQRI